MYENFARDVAKVAELETAIDALEATRPRTYATTAAVPAASPEADPIAVGAILVDTQAKEVYQVTAVGEDGTLTNTQIGSWT